jgi:hypothetical protein
MLSKGFKGYIQAAALASVVAACPLAAQADLTWTERNPNAGAAGQPDVTQVIYAGGHYVAVGDGTILESDDGVTWTDVYQLTAQSFDVPRVAYGNGIYVAGFGVFVDDGSGQNITVEKGSWATSKDGVHWTPAHAHNPPASEIVFADDQFTVVGTSCGENTGVQIQPGDTFTCSAADIQTSTDGQTWITHAPTADGAFFLPKHLGFANGLFLTFMPAGVNTDKAYVSNDAVNWQAVASLGMNVDGFDLGPIRVFGGTVRALSDQGYPVIATSHDEHAWEGVGYLRGFNSQRDQVRDAGYFKDMVSYGDALLAPVVAETKFSMWLGHEGQQEWCDLSGFPASAHGVAMAVNGGQIVVVGATGEIFSTPPAASAVALSCDSGGDTFPGDLTAKSIPVSSGGKGTMDPFILMGLLGLAGLRRRGGARHSA